MGVFVRQRNGGAQQVVAIIADARELADEQHIAE